jgi:hypothetical protein
LRRGAPRDLLCRDRETLARRSAHGSRTGVTPRSASRVADAVVDRAAPPELAAAEIERAVDRRRAGSPSAPAPFLAAPLGALRVAPRLELAVA